jgi:hypothetical protein
MPSDPFAHSERSLTMFRKVLSFIAGVLALLGVTGSPSQLHAQVTRLASPRGTGVRGTVPQLAVPQVGRFSPGFDRRFLDPRFGGFRPAFDPLFLNPGFSGFRPAFDPLFLDPRFGGISPGFDRQFLEDRFGGF